MCNITVYWAKHVINKLISYCNILNTLMREQSSHVIEISSFYCIYLQCKPTLCIYDLHSLRKRKVLSSSEFVKSNEYVSLAFSPDSKYLVAQSGKPDYTLLYWTWEKSKVMAVQKTSNPNTNAPVYQVSLTILLWHFCLDICALQQFLF